MKGMHDLRDAIRSSIDSKLSDYMRKIGSGQMRDFAEYKNNTGRVQGLNDARTMVDAVFAKLLQEDEE